MMMEKTEEAMERALSILAAHEMAKNRMEEAMKAAKEKAAKEKSKVRFFFNHHVYVCPREIGI
jgi:hypothetical protein